MSRNGYFQFRLSLRYKQDYISYHELEFHGMTHGMTHRRWLAGLHFIYLESQISFLFQFEREQPQ